LPFLTHLTELRTKRRTALIIVVLLVAYVIFAPSFLGWPDGHDAGRARPTREEAGRHDRRCAPAAGIGVILIGAITIMRDGST
jgi:hypothetical protein